MHTRKITRNWAIAGAVAAMMAASTMGVRAQDAAAPMATPPAAPAPDATTPPATPAPDASMPMAPAPAPMAPSAMPAPMSGSMSGAAPTDYSILSNRYFDYVDLQQARARGLSESQIATVVKISKLTGLSFRRVSAAVERGETFPSLATQYNLRLNDVYEIDKEKQDIADYTSLYDVASSFSKASGPMMAGSMASEPMTPAPMTPPMADSSTPPMDASKPMAGGMTTLDIVDTAMAAKNLTTLVKALQVAGLVETLKGSGPFTVFAPDDKAFSKLPAGALDALLADPAKLKTVLTYHVIPASIMAADAEAMTSPTSPPTVEGGTLQVTKGRKGRLKINDATVIKGDIKASNGVIHIIDRVLMPPAEAMAPAPDATATPPAAPAPDATATPPAAPAPDAAMPPAVPAPAPGDTTTPPAAPPAPAPAQ